MPLMSGDGTGGGNDCDLVHYRAEFIALGGLVTLNASRGWVSLIAWGKGARAESFGQYLGRCKRALDVDWDKFPGLPGWKRRPFLPEKDLGCRFFSFERLASMFPKNVQPYHQAYSLYPTPCSLFPSKN